MAPLKFGQTIHANGDEHLFEQVRQLIHTLRPNWNTLKFNKYTSGITNTVLSVQNDNSGDTEKLVVRIFGNGTDSIIDRKDEQAIFTLLCQHDLAPPVYACFLNGFVCGYLPGEPVTAEMLRNPKILPRICETIAKMHQVPVACPDTPFLFSKMKQFLDNIPKRFADSEKQRLYEHYFGNVNFEQELNNLRALIANVKHTRQVLCHNDLLFNNILYDSNSDVCHIIDYEYTAVNYQIFDLANHFNEYAGVDDVNFDLCPNDEEKYAFIRTYLRFYLGSEPTEIEVMEMLREIPKFEAASHLFWITWNIVQASVSSIDFDYLTYSTKRYEQYKKIMQKLRAQSI